MTKLTAQRLREVLSYDQESGLFTWLRNRGSARAGVVAGCLYGDGYWRISIDGAQYAAHRLAFLFMLGQFPADEVDHINGNRVCNAWANLRNASRNLNQQNRRIASKSSDSGVLGAFMHRASGKFESSIEVNGRRVYLGLFDSAADAGDAYLAAKRRLHDGCTI